MTCLLHKCSFEFSNLESLIKSLYFMIYKNQGLDFRGAHEGLTQKRVVYPCSTSCCSYCPSARAARPLNENLPSTWTVCAVLMDANWIWLHFSVCFLPSNYQKTHFRAWRSRSVFWSVLWFVCEVLHSVSCSNSDNQQPRTHSNLA